MGEVKSPEHCPFRRCYNKSFANCPGVDAKWNSGRVHQEKSKRKSYRPGKSFPVVALDR